MKVKNKNDLFNEFPSFCALLSNYCKVDAKSIFNEKNGLKILFFLLFWASLIVDIYYLGIFSGKKMAKKHTLTRYHEQHESKILMDCRLSDVLFSYIHKKKIVPKKRVAESPQTRY